MSMQKEQAVNTVLNEAEKTISKHYGIKCMGRGATMMYEVEDLSLMFSINRPLNKKEARQIIVEASEEFLDIINKSNVLRKYLKNVPFGPENIVMSILIYNRIGERACYPDISTIILVKEKIEYMKKSSKNKLGYKETIDELFEEAKQIVEQQKQQELQKFD